DDEIEQTISTLQSVNIQTEHYTAVEGQWVLKAAELARAASPAYQSVYGHSCWKQRQEQKLRLNGLQDLVHISSELITAANFPALIRQLTMRTGSWQPINYMDWDCQGCESLLANPAALKLFEENVLHMFITVHGMNYRNLNATNGHLAMVNTGAPTYQCDREGSRGLLWARGFEDDNRCESPVGPIYYRDGSLSVFNKQLFDKMGLQLRLPKCLPWLPN
ncbi:hypothetical protein B484DRAFT_404460, partial [Ochromonadaceae sp. CCMP2298]